MNSIWIITKRELRTFFDSLIAYILIVGFLGFTGFFTWLYGSDIFFIGQATLKPFFSVAQWTLFFFIPALTMRMIAEEKRSGTIELLLTKSVNDWQVVAGKFLAVLLLIVTALVLTLPYYFSILYLGPVDHGAVWTGYLGMVLMSMAFIGIGIFASSITTNQIVAFLAALFIGIFFLLIFDMLAQGFTGDLARFLNYMSIQTHYESVSRGVIDTRNLVYFFSVTFLSLFLAETVLSKRNIVE